MRSISVVCEEELRGGEVFGDEVMGEFGGEVFAEGVDGALAGVT